MIHDQRSDTTHTNAAAMTPARTGERRRAGLIAALLIGALVAPRLSVAGDTGTANAGGAPAADDFATVMARMKAAKAGIEKRQAELLADRYDLSDHPVATLRMSHGKPVQGGVRAKLAPGVTWETLAALRPEEIRTKDVFPA